MRRAGAGASTASPTRQSVAVLSPYGDEIQSVDLDAEPLKVDRGRRRHRQGCRHRRHARRHRRALARGRGGGATTPPTDPSSDQSSQCSPAVMGTAEWAPTEEARAGHAHLFRLAASSSAPLAVRAARAQPMSAQEAGRQADQGTSRGSLDRPWNTSLTRCSTNSASCDS